MGKTQNKTELSTKNWVVKSNALNEVRNSRMKISQLRLFSIYLSKINPNEKESRAVKFSLDEYTKIMQFKQANITRMIKTAKDLVGISVTFLGNKEGVYQNNRLREFTTCAIFKSVKLRKEDDGEWYVSIDCNDDVLHLMFELKKHYFKYKLWNAMQLTSPNQLRMYELLKQYEYVGAREINVQDLREFLGLKKDEYTRWNNFRARILDASQTALASRTDIKYTWEVAGRLGKGGKIKTIKFNIEKNDDYIRQFTIDEFFLEQGENVIEGDMQEFEVENETEEAGDDIVSFLSEACENEFIREEVTLLHDYIVKIVPYGHRNRSLDLYDYLKSKYDELNYRAMKTDIKNRFGYLKKIIEMELKTTVW